MQEKRLIDLDDLLNKIDEKFGFVDTGDEYGNGYDNGVQAVTNIILDMPVTTLNEYGK